MHKVTTALNKDGKNMVKRGCYIRKNSDMIPFFCKREVSDACK